MTQFKDRVTETSTSQGIVSMVLGGALQQQQSFSAAYDVGEEFEYCIQHSDKTINEWEVGRGQLNSAGELVRTTLKSSTNNNSKVNFSAGIKYVFSTYSADLIKSFETDIESLKNITPSNDKALPTQIPFSSALDLSGYYYSNEHLMSGPINYTLKEGAVPGGKYFHRNIGNGVDIPNFSGEYVETASSRGYDKTANVVNILNVFYDGNEALFTWSHRKGDIGQIVPELAPENTVAPVLSGGAVGQTLTSTNGTWSGNPTPTYSQVFKLDGVTVSAPYTLVSGDVGKVATCEVTATNSEGSATATSNSMTVVVVAGDTTAPAFTSFVVENTSPTIVTYTADEELDQSVTLDAGDFAISGKTVSSVAFGSATTIEVTVSAAFVNGDSATASYTNNSGLVRDAAGNQTVTTTGNAITNNVGAASAATEQSVQFSDILGFVESEAGGVYTYTGTSTNNNYRANSPALKIANGSNATLTVRLSKTTANECKVCLGTNPATTSSSLSTNIFGVFGDATANEEYVVIEGGTGAGDVAPNVVARDYVDDDCVRINVFDDGSANLQISSDGGNNFTTIHNYTNTYETDLYCLIDNVGTGAVDFNVWQEGGVAV